LTLINTNTYENNYLIYYKIYLQHPLLFAFLLGDWGLGIGDWGLGPIPNPQSPISLLLKVLHLIKILEN